jgi:hypothetical protein
LIGEEGVATPHRHIEGIEQGAQGGPFQEAHIRVPHAADVPSGVLFLEHRQDLWMAVQGQIVRMDHELAEAPAQGFVLVGTELLVVEAQHQMAHQCLADLADALLARIGQIDARNPGTGRPWARVLRRRLPWADTIADRPDTVSHTCGMGWPRALCPAQARS